MFNPADIQTGMVVRDRDGEKLGMITAVDASGFLIEKGPYFTQDYRVGFSDVMDLDGDDVYLRADLASLPGVNLEAVGGARTAAAGEDVALHHDLTGGLGLEPRDLEQARMDSAKFQDHGQYSVGEAARPRAAERERRREEVISGGEPSVVAVQQPPVTVERRSARDEEDTARREAPADRDSHTRH